MRWKSVIINVYILLIHSANVSMKFFLIKISIHFLSILSIKNFILRIRKRKAKSFSNNINFFIRLQRCFTILIIKKIVFTFHLNAVNMATSTSETTCLLCNKTRKIYICKACSNQFCFDHLTEHRTNIRQQFDYLHKH